LRGDIVLFLGLVAVIGGSITLAVIFIFGNGGGGNSPCDEMLAPLGEGTLELSQEAFQQEDVGLTKVIQAASAGNIESTETAFYGEVHNFTHNLDPHLRPVDDELAVNLCEDVIAIEEELVAADRSVGELAILATRIREQIRDAAEALGYARPGG
jgi:hypothetical protein